MSDVTYYTLADERYAIGATAMVASLRLTGHAGEIVVLDNGMTEAQAARLAREATVVRLPPELVGRETLAKAYSHRIHPGGVFVWVDADVLVTGSLLPAVEQARAGRIVSARVEHEEEARRVFPEWETALALTAPVRRGETYLCSGFIAFDADRYPTLLRRWWETSEVIPPGTLFQGEPAASPFWAQEQDAFNALLMSEIPPGVAAALGEAEMAYRSHLRSAKVDDPQTLACSYRGRPITLVHLSWRPKPWLPDGRHHARRDVYHRLVPRVLFADDAPLPVPREEVVPWLRGGLEGRRAIAVATARRSARTGARTVLRALPSPVQRRVDALRGTAAAG